MRKEKDDKSPHHGRYVAFKAGFCAYNSHKMIWKLLQLNANKEMLLSPGGIGRDSVDELATLGLQLVCCVTCYVDWMIHTILCTYEFVYQ